MIKAIKFVLIKQIKFVLIKLVGFDSRTNRLMI
jgi:hypothetical protein